MLAFIASVCLLTLKYITSDLVNRHHVSPFFFFFCVILSMCIICSFFADGNGLRFTRSLVYAAMECRCVARNWVCRACRIRPRFVILKGVSITQDKMNNLFLFYSLALTFFFLLLFNVYVLIFRIAAIRYGY